MLLLTRKGKVRPLNLNCISKVEMSQPEIFSGSLHWEVVTGTPILILYNYAKNNPSFRTTAFLTKLQFDFFFLFYGNYGKFCGNQTGAIKLKRVWNPFSLVFMCSTPLFSIGWLHESEGTLWNKNTFGYDLHVILYKCKEQNDQDKMEIIGCLVALAWNGIRVGNNFSQLWGLDATQNLIHEYWNQNYPWFDGHMH